MRKTICLFFSLVNTYKWSHENHLDLQLKALNYNPIQGVYASIALIIIIVFTLCVQSFEMYIEGVWYTS